MRLGSKSVWGGLAGLLVLVLAGGAWRGREPILAWWSLRGLEQADENERDRWAERVAERGKAVVPGLVEGLDRDDARVRANVAAALLRLAGRGQADDLVRRLEENFPRFGPTGQEAALRLGTAWLKGDGEVTASADTAAGLARLLPEAGRSKETGVRAAALELGGQLLERPEHADALAPCRELALACFADGDADNRARALQLSLNPGMDLQRQVLPLLSDPAPEVRRLAILAVGPATDVIVTEDLLRWLHDPDPEVRRLCELALRGRRLPETHIRLGRLLTHEEPKIRLQVLDYLHQANDLDPGVWLRYLSHDPVPSVRAAAMRAATSSTYENVPFSDRLDQMRADPCPTVKQLATYFLPLKKRQESTASP